MSVFLGTLYLRKVLRCSFYAGFPNARSVSGGGTSLCGAPARSCFRAAAEMGRQTSISS
jgi:hypothetical protein